MRASVPQTVHPANRHGGLERSDSIVMISHMSIPYQGGRIAVRYDANEVAAGVTEVLAYGTAVVVEPS